MLVHVTRFAGSASGSASVQQRVHDQIEDHVRQARQRIARAIDDGPVLERMRALWAREFESKETTIRDAHPDLCGRHVSWEELVAALPEALEDIELRRINGTAKDALDYVDHEGTGLKVIAIGGDKLSRGLTLEGLTVSYFLRASKMYDTLMQMGRWFGYRPGYLDLCRLYTTPELVEWFGHITDAADELREEFDLMASSGATPREYGLKVQSHSVLLVTSPLKMRTAKDLQLSFAGQMLETVAFRRDRIALSTNLNAAKRLIQNRGPAIVSPSRPRPGERVNKWEDALLWEGVDAEDVAGFLASYLAHPNARKVQGPLVAEFIRGMVLAGELTSWTVAVLSGEGKPTTVADFGAAVPMISRQAESGSEEENRYSIGRLLAPRDEGIDFDEPAWQEALDLTKRTWTHDASKRRAKSEPDTPSGPALRHVRGFGGARCAAHPERGLLLLYPMSPEPVFEAGDERRAFPVIGFAVSFPGSNSGTRVSYRVNNVLWEQEYGASE